MAIKNAINGRQFDSFEENLADGGTDRRVAVKNTSSDPVPTQDIYYNKYADFTYPNTVTDVITWYDDNTKAVLFSTITVVYTDATKRDLLSFDEVFA